MKRRTAGIAVVGGVRRATLVVLVALVLVILLALGCTSDQRASNQRTSNQRTSVEAPSEKVVVAAGDIAACHSDDDEATARLPSNIRGTVLTLGDNAYEDGTPEEFAECYDPSLGRYKARTKPTPGNHEYHTQGAEGYFDYFGDAAGDAAGDPDEGYYSNDLGSWHMVALNSNCQEVGGCGDASPQVRWLEEDLAANDEKTCTLVYFHHPLFTSGNYRPGVPEVKPLWEALYAAGADVVLNGHDHNYQRFAPQDPEGRADPQRGIRQFVVGTGGKSHYAIVDPIANSEVHNDDTNGVLKLTLRPEGYEWRFVPVEREAFTTPEAPGATSEYPPKGANFRELHSSTVSPIAVVTERLKAAQWTKPRVAPLRSGGVHAESPFPPSDRLRSCHKAGHIRKVL